MSDARPSRKRRRRMLAVAIGLVSLLAVLFAWNGLETSWRVPESGITGEPAPSRDVITVMAWNLAKCDFHEGGLDFRTEDQVRARLDDIAVVVVENDVDLLFLSEVVFEAWPCDVNQIAYLAEKAGFHAWCYGDNYSFGIPGARIRAGNAILSRYPLDPQRVEQLPGGAPFWNPTGNRRLLWAEVELDGTPILCGSIRNDSFDLASNAVQTQVILDALTSDAVLLAGDFNATPSDRSFELLRASEKFGGVFDGPATYPAHHPTRRIDTVLIPASWPGPATHSVLDVDLSDHEPVVVSALWR